MVAAFGAEFIYFARVEGAFDTVAAFVGTDAVQLNDLKFEPRQDYKKSKERRGTASLISEIRGYRGGKFTAVCYVSMNAAGTAPPSAAFHHAAFAAAPTTPGGTATLYSLSAPAGPPTLQLGRLGMSSGQYEIVNGAVVENVEVEGEGNGECKITFTGSYATHGWAYRSTFTGTIAAAATTWTPAAADRGKYGVNGRCSIGTNTNGGVGYLITAVDQTTGAVTFSPGLTTADQINPVIVGYAPTASFSGTAVGGIDCGLSIDSTAIGVNSFKISFKTGNRLLEKEATRNRAGRSGRGEREITGELMVYALDDENLALIGRAWQGSLHNQILRIGPDTAGSRLLITTPSVRWNVTPIDVPEAEEATAKITWVARRSSANDDEMTWNYS